MKKLRLLTGVFFTCAILIQTKSFAEPQNLSLLKSNVQSYHDSGEYEAELSKVAANADAYIMKRANVNSKLSVPQKLALVLDIDETSISNYNNMLQHDFSGNFSVIEKSFLNTKAVPIRPILALYNDALKHHVAVFFITGRPEKYKESTIASLSFAGYHDWTNLYLKPDNYHEKSIVQFKSQMRTSLEKQGYTVIASIGDQWSDLQGGAAEHVYKLPNPYYFIK